MKAIAQSGYALEFAGPDVKSDRTVAQAAVRRSGIGILPFASLTHGLHWNEAHLDECDKSLLKDGEIVLSAVSKDGLALELADKLQRADFHAALAACAQNG